MVLIFLKPNTTKNRIAHNLIFATFFCLNDVHDECDGSNSNKSVYGCAKPVFAILLSLSVNDFEYETE